jgi:hypothetical protein
MALATACSGTETDNPVVQQAPVRFEPEAPEPGACPPPEEDQPPRELALWGKSGEYLVGVDNVGSIPRRGLVVVDVSDPASPRVVAEQALIGYPRQLIVEGSSVTLVIDELAMFDGPPLPDPGELETQTKLVRFDLSNPEAPVRVAEAPLDGEFWQVEVRGDGYWVMSARIDPATLRCDAQPNLCGYVSREAMLFTHYTWSGTAFTAGERVEVPAGMRAWMTEQGFATATGGFDDGVLHFAAFDGDGSLLPARTIPLGGAVVTGSPIYFDGERIGVFLYDLQDGDADFSLRDLEGNELGRVDGFGQGLGFGTHFVPGGALVASGSPGQPGTFIDFSDPSAITSEKTPEAGAFLPVDTSGTSARVLGWSTSASGERLSFSLWSLEGGELTLLDRLATSLSAPQEPRALVLDGSRLLVAPINPPNPPEVVSLSWAGDQLVLEGPVSGGYGDQLIAVGDWVYEGDVLGLAFGNLANGDARRQRWDAGDAQDVAAIPGGEAQLLLRYEDGMYLDVVRDGARETLAVSPGARRVLSAGDHVIVLATDPADQCSQTGLDCSDYAPGISILALDPLRSVAELPLPEPPGGGEVIWDVAADGTQPPLRLGDDTWLLGGELTSPGDQRVLYVLDVASARVSEPLVVDHGRSAPYDLWPHPIGSGGVLLDLRLEPSYFPPRGGPRPTTSAFWLERYSPTPSGALDALPELRIPGYPVGLLGDGSLISVAPGTGANGTATLYHSRLGETVQVQASRAVEERFGGAAIVGQNVAYVRLPADPCDPVTHLETYALDDRLSPRGSLELPGAAWRVLGSSDTELVLELSDQRSFARVTIDSEGSPTLVGFATSPSVVWGENVDGNAVLGLSGGGVVRVSP